MKKRWPLARGLLVAATLGVCALWPTLSQTAPAGAYLPAAAPSAARSTSYAPAGEPIAVAVLQNGDILVTDVNRAGVRRFSSDGTSKAAYADQVEYPTG